MQQLKQVRIFQFTNNQAKLYIEQFFRHLEKCYQEFVEYNFPTFKDDFHFYTNCPHEYFFYMEDDDILRWGRFGYRPSRCGETKTYYGNKSFDRAFNEDAIITLRPFSFDDIIYNDYGPERLQTIYRINTREVDKFCVIRKWMYTLLRSDMEKLFRENEN